MNENQLLTGKRTFVVVIIILLITVWAVYVITQGVGKTAVNVEVIPSDAKITMDGEEIESGRQLLAPGKYTFMASVEGFSDFETNVIVGTEELLVGLLPEPKTSDAFAQIADEQSQLQREALGGVNAGRIGLEREKQTPLLEQLPITKLTNDAGDLAPFTIDYGPSEEREFGTFLIISNSSPRGRQNAVSWLQQQNNDPAELEIEYQDYKNPFVLGGVQ